jgi:serine O-acetyltransferase
VDIQRNFSIDHFGGIIISSGYAKFGHNCLSRNGGLVGLRLVYEPRAPIIDNDVVIGAAAKVCGPIPMGNNVAIDANAVVISDVPDDSITAVVPAVITPRGYRS